MLQAPPELGFLTSLALGTFWFAYTCLVYWETQLSPPPPPKKTKKLRTHHPSSCPSPSPGTDRQSWLVAGTNRGYLLLWDLRFQLLVKVRPSARVPIAFAWIERVGGVLFFLKINAHTHTHIY